ncbi:hypothetical protein AB0M28_29830, partial [Streptomyces sp. NPDC051940]|uniref:hypothetical protein n=1 Tax=Streptomyces sp. NPDC051940 TaxID=3155675 RepID=UPI00342019C1
MKRFAPHPLRVRAAVMAAALLAALAALSVPPAGPARAAAPDAGAAAVGYTLVGNQYREEASLGDCLRTFSGSTAVQVGACTAQGGATDYTSMRLWQAVDQGNGYVLLQNKYRADAGLGTCLRTLSGSDTVQVGDCAGQGGASDYTSMRLWRVVDQGAGRVQLQNKYRADAGLGTCLRTVSGADTVQVGACAAQGGTGDLASMRLWDDDAFAAAWPVRSVTGQKRALVMATHWNDAAPADPAAVEQAVLGSGYPSLRSYLQEVSGGQLDLTGDMLTGVDLGARPTGCDSTAIRAAATAAAQARGVDPASYDYLLVDISRTSACAWEGLASMPGNWILSNGVGYKTWMWTHEFGHNLGFTHSDTLKSCPVSGSTVLVGASCTVAGGDDPTDTMGGGGMHLYPVDYRQFAGWIPDAQVPKLSASGAYQLGVLGESGVQEYRIPRGDGSYLSLEYRRATPPYDDYAAGDPLVNGVIVRIVSSGSTVHNRLVDATPATATTDDAPLPVGGVLADEVASAGVRVCSVGTSGADLRVSVAGTTPPAATSCPRISSRGRNGGSGA